MHLRIRNISSPAVVALSLAHTSSLALALNYYYTAKSWLTGHSARFRVLLLSSSSRLCACFMYVVPTRVAQVELQTYLNQQAASVAQFASRSTNTARVPVSIPSSTNTLFAFL